MSREAFNLNYSYHEGVNLDELKLLVENTIFLEKEYKYPIYKKSRNYKKDLIKADKQNKKVAKLYKKIEKLKSKIAKLYGVQYGNDL